MDDTIIIPAIAGFLGLILTVYFTHLWRTKARKEALQVQAEMLGFDFLHKAARSDIKISASLSFFKKGNSKKYQNLLSRTNEERLLQVFDYEYTVGSGKNKSVYKQTVLLVADKGINLPAFLMKPENIFHKIGAAFGAQDIDFEAYPEFSKRYLLRGDDEAAIRQLFDDNVLKHFDIIRGWLIEGNQGMIIACKNNKIAKAETISEFLKDGLQAVDKFI